MLWFKVLPEWTYIWKFDKKLSLKNKDWFSNIFLFSDLPLYTFRGCYDTTKILVPSLWFACQSQHFVNWKAHKDPSWLLLVLVAATALFAWIMTIRLYCATVVSSPSRRKRRRSRMWSKSRYLRWHHWKTLKYAQSMKIIQKSLIWQCWSWCFLVILVLLHLALLCHSSFTSVGAF